MRIAIVLDIVVSSEHYQTGYIKQMISSHKNTQLQYWRISGQTIRLRPIVKADITDVDEKAICLR